MFSFPDFMLLARFVRVMSSSSELLPEDEKHLYCSVLLTLHMLTVFMLLLSLPVESFSSSLFGCVSFFSGVFTLLCARLFFTRLINGSSSELGSQRPKRKRFMSVFFVLCFIKYISLSFALSPQYLGSLLMYGLADPLLSLHFSFWQLSALVEGHHHPSCCLQMKIL